MSRTLSSNMLEMIHAQDTDEVFLPLVKLTQADWDDSIRLVPNTEAITHDSEVYSPLAFAIGLPDEEAEGVPVLNWVADNVDRRMIEALRSVSGVVQAEIVWVLASTPNVVEIGPMSVEMRAVQYDALQIRGTMGVEPILQTQFGTLVMNPINAPGLF